MFLPILFSTQSCDSKVYIFLQLKSIVCNQWKIKVSVFSSGADFEINVYNTCTCKIVNWIIHVHPKTWVTDVLLWVKKLFENYNPFSV